MRRCVITGAGLVSSLGDTPAAFHEALCAGRSALRPVDLFDVSRDVGQAFAGQLDFDAREHLEGNVRPLDRTGQLVTTAAQRTLRDGGWTPEACEAASMGLVLGTMFCSLRTIAGFDRRAVEAGPQYAKPFDFANSVINAASGQAAIWHGLRGINSTVAGGPAAGLLALGYAADMIRLGRADAILAGGAEELCQESFVGFDKAGWLGTANDARVSVPLDAERDGCWLGEGAAFLVLEEASAAERRGATVLAELAGHGNAFDPSRGHDVRSASGAVARALRQALSDAGTDAVDALSLGANGRVDGDLHEALGVREALGDAVAELPVTAVKSMTGEALGAGGVFQTLALLETLRTGRWPGILGLEKLDENLPYGRAPASASDVEVGRGAVLGQSFDGNAAALVLTN